MNNMLHRADEKLYIETEFKEALTSSSCTILIAEIIKYILYLKQQLPFTFDRLKYVVTRKWALRESEVTKKAAWSNAEQLFKVAEENFVNLETLFEKTKQELANSRGNISEVALLFGGTPLTPKQVYHIHLPELNCGHLSKNHSDRNYLPQLVQSIVQSNELNEMLMKPMNPTNMYFLIKKNKVNKKSNLHQWFLPKTRYQIPSNCAHFHIKLRHPPPENRTCSCDAFNVYIDNSDKLDPHSNSSFKRENNVYISEESDSEWYQASKIFKGFKDVYVNGVSVSNSWLR